VALVVSLGPELVEVPNVLAQGVDAATEELEAAGFVVSERQADPYLGLGYVAEQDPAGGANAPYGSTITLFLV
jgi:serine/threonine-protein kinase